MFRVYENDAPLRAQHFLKWNAKGPARTSWSSSPATLARPIATTPSRELETQRDVIYPLNVQVVKRRIAVLRRVSPARRRAGAAGRGRHLQPGERAEGAKRRVQRPARREDHGEEGGRRARAARSRSRRTPNGKTAYASAWDDDCARREAHRELYKRSASGRFADPASPAWDWRIVRYVREIKKPDGQRLNGYPRRAAAVAEVRAAVAARRSIRRWKSCCSPTPCRNRSRSSGPTTRSSKAVLGRPARRKRAAAAYVSGTKLDRPGGPQTADRWRRGSRRRSRRIRSSSSAARSSRSCAQMKDRSRREVESVETAARQKIGQARFAVVRHVGLS